MKCLVIIDMQRHFQAARHLQLIFNIVNKVKEYIERNESIIILEFYDDDDDLGRTVPEILDVVDEYKNCFIVGKDQNDGGEEISGIINEQSLDISEFEVCGVNLDACVMDTVVTMAWYYPDTPISVILDCCNSVTGQKDAIADFNYEMEDCGKRNVAIV